jgi:hypothetical protein
MQNYNFPAYLLWVWNLVPHVKGRTQIEGVSEWNLGEYLNLWGIKWQEAAENCLMSYTVCILHHLLLRWSDKGGWDAQSVACMGNNEKGM